MSTVIDAHNHAGIRHGAAQTGEDLVKKMDQTGVDKAVIFPFVEGDFSNDVMNDYHKQFPDRLIPFCAVNPWLKERAVQELMRCVDDLGFKGLKLHPTLHGYHLADHGLVDPIFQMAQDLGIPIICHGASDLYNNPLEFAEMARTFPEVPLIMAHMGFFWSVDQAIELAKSIPNLYLETSRAPIFEINVAVKELGPQKVIWGTDSPFVDYEWEFKKMERAADSREAYEWIVGGNMAKLLRL
jgi:predicted TIM-barrel fold metal-dependent hydrolase